MVNDYDHIIVLQLYAFNRKYRFVFFMSILFLIFYYIYYISYRGLLQNIINLKYYEIIC